MTRAAIRTELATAANNVDGVTCAEYFVQNFAPGRAWIRWDRSERPDPFGYVTWWNVVVLLPEDLAQAEKFAEQITEPLVQALIPHLAVTNIAPQQIQIAGKAALPALFITGHREE